jgi:glucose/arabinose dehydrogenase
MLKRFLAATAAFTLLSAPAYAKIGDSVTVTGTDGGKLTATHLETFNKAWAMAFLPDGRMVVTEKGGDIWLLDENGKKLGEITGGPSVTDRGQGGMGDIYIPDDFAQTSQVYISYVERDENDNNLSGAVVERATLSLSANGGSFENRQEIWEQLPKMRGNGHYGHRIAVSPDNYLFISSGDRQHFWPSQNMSTNIGKMVRLNRDGSVPDDNPFAAQGSITAQIWSLGHRNPLGLAFNAEGQLWSHEMGPAHGDELNRIIRSENYGYPVVSNGDHYNGTQIPDHDEFPIYEAPKVWWDPAISPAGLAFVDGDQFSAWQGDALIGGLSSQALVRVDMDGEPKEAARYEWDKRIREVEMGPDGAIYVLEDRRNGRLMKLTPAE